MRIVTTSADRSSAGRAGPSRGKRDSSATTSVSGKKAPSFLDILEEVLPPAEAANYDLRTLWSELPEVERDLLEESTQEHLARYKQLIRKIAQAALRRNYRVHQLKRRSSTGEDLELNVVEVVDRRLHEMTLMMQSPQNSAFFMLKTFEEIRGLLIDVRD